MPNGDAASQYAADAIRAEKRVAQLERAVESMSIGARLALSYLPDRLDDVHRVLEHALEVYETTIERSDPS